MVKEMILRIAVIILFIGSMGFTATAIAEAAAWTGALILNMTAYFINIRKFSHTTIGEACVKY